MYPVTKHQELLQHRVGSTRTIGEVLVPLPVEEVPRELLLLLWLCVRHAGRVMFGAWGKGWEGAVVK